MAQPQWKKTDHIVQRQGICEKNQENTTANKRKEFSQTNFLALYRSIDKWTTKRLQTYDKNTPQSILLEGLFHYNESINKDFQVHVIPISYSGRCFKNKIVTRNILRLSQINSDWKYQHNGYWFAVSWQKTWFYLAWKQKLYLTTL